MSGVQALTAPSSGDGCGSQAYPQGPSPHAEPCRLQASSGRACLPPALLLNGEELEYGFPLTFILPINGLLDSQ